MTNYEQAIDDMFGMIRTNWNSSTTAIVGYVPALHWPGIEEPINPDLSKFWARVSQVTAIEEQSSFKNSNDIRLYRSVGNVYVQIFCPRSSNLSTSKGRKLAIIARNSFRGKRSSNGVWFRNSRIVELPPETNWYRFTVVSEYEYQENG